MSTCISAHDEPDDWRDLYDEPAVELAGGPETFHLTDPSALPTSGRVGFTAAPQRGPQMESFIPHEGGTGADRPPLPPRLGDYALGGPVDERTADEKEAQYVVNVLTSDHCPVMPGSIRTAMIHVAEALLAAGAPGSSAGREPLTEDEQRIVSELRREVRGNDRGGWQPMISAREVRALLDLIDRLTARRESDERA